MTIFETNDKRISVAAVDTTGALVTVAGETAALTRAEALKLHHALLAMFHPLNDLMKAA